MRTRNLCSGKILVITAAILGSMGVLAGDSWAEGKPSYHPAGVADPGKAPGPTSPGKPDMMQLVENYSRLPLYFIENRGQVASEVRYYLPGPGPRIAFTSREAVLSLNQGQAAQIRLTPLGMRPEVQIKGLAPQKAMVNYLLGSDPKQWRTEVPTCGAVLYQEAYPGIDLKFYGTGRQLEYDVIVQPGADPGKVKFRCKGARSVKVNADGDLVISLPRGGELRQRRPVVYQEIDGRRVEREGGFKLAKSPQVYGFTLGAFDPRYPLIIDPFLVFSTYFGNAGGPGANNVTAAVDDAGQVYITGTTTETAFPTTPGVFQTTLGGSKDVFVAKFTAAGALVYSTYLGGSGSDSGNSIAVDQEGSAFITGMTTSSDFPVTASAYAKTRKGIQDAFVTKLNGSGSALVYSTYLGGSDDDFGNAIALNQQGEAFVTGVTYSSDFPVTPGAYQGNIGGGCDAFVTRLNLAGSDLVYSTYLGGSEDDQGYGIAVDATGAAHVTGFTTSTDFPLNLAFQSANAGNTDAFITKVVADGSSLTYSTYLGGSGNETGYGIATDAKGASYVTGSTNSDDFPTANPIIKRLHGDSDAFVTKVASSLFPKHLNIIYSTYLGGSDHDTGNAIAVDAQGCAYVAGTTTSSDFPTRNSLFPYRTCDAFITKLNASGSQWLFSTFLGGSSTDFGTGVAVDRQGSIYVSGFTYSTDFPTVHAWKGSRTGSSYIAFLTKIRLSGAGEPVNYLLLGD